MTHAAAGRRGAAGDEADHGFLAAAPRLIREELRGVLLGGTADLADHDDRLGRLVGEQHLQHLDELGALHRIAADADGGGLPEPLAGGLVDRLVGHVWPRHVSRALTLAPWRTSSSATSRDPARAASIKAVWPSWFGASTLLPASSSIATRGALATLTASANGLEP